MTLKTEHELEELVNDLKVQLEGKGDWTEIKRPVLPRFEYNIYAYMDYGRVMSNGLHETKIGTVTVRYNGEVSFSSHL